MKQKIYRYTNGSILNITNYNSIGQLHGLRISYHSDGSIWWISNYVNNKPFGLGIWKFSSGKIGQKYYL